jgi:hypothetical protein
MGNGTFCEFTRMYQILNQMRFIPTRIHGIMDYLTGILLIASPWLLDFANGGADTWIPVILGAGAIVYSLMTDYEMGISRKIQMSSHLSLDMMSGILLASSPWVFDFSEDVYGPHLVLGIMEIAVSLLTSKRPAHEGQHQVLHSD